MANEFLGSEALGRVVADLRLAYFDIGARGAPKDDLLPLAPAMEAVLFEPDPGGVLDDPGSRWRSIRHVDVALGGERGRRRLYITSRGGTSSMLRADRRVAEAFGRADHFDVIDEIELNTLPLDDVLTEWELPTPTFMKIDIEGLELEVLKAAPLAVGGLVGLRIEVALEQLYVGQPLFHDVNAFLYGAGFRPMRFLEEHHWRRTTKRKYPDLAAGRIPYSQGQLVHGDVLYLRGPETVDHPDEPVVERRLAAALVALCYENVDHARALLAIPVVEDALVERWGIRDLEAELHQVSRTLLAAARRREVDRLRRTVRAQLRHALRR